TRSSFARRPTRTSAPVSRSGFEPRGSSGPTTTIPPAVASSFISWGGRRERPRGHPDMATADAGRGRRARLPLPPRREGDPPAPLAGSPRRSRLGRGPAGGPRPAPAERGRARRPVRIRSGCAGAPRPVRIFVYGVDDGEFEPRGWWRSRRYAKTFLFESVKLVWTYLVER